MNGADRVQRLGEVMVQGVIRPAEGGTELRSVAQRRDAVADEIGRGAFLAGWAKGSACAPKHGETPRMRMGVHAAHRSVWGGERSRSWAAESRSTTRMVPPQTGQFQSE